MNRGYIKIWRKIEDTAIFTNSEAMHLFLYCIIKASRERRVVYAGKTEVTLEQGQFITGRKMLASILGSTEQRIRTSIEILTKNKIINQQTTNKYSIITVLNWDLYQEGNQQTTSKQPASNQQTTTKQECKRIIEVKEKDSFDLFWNAYPRKQAKGAAEKAFAKVSDKIDIILTALEWQSKLEEWKKDGGKFIPLPASYLNGKRWEDQKMNFAQSTKYYDFEDKRKIIE